MYVERLLEINLATMSVISALMAGMGERSLGPPLIVSAAAMLSLWLTDAVGWIRLNRTVAGLAAVGALVWALTWSGPMDGERLLLKVAHLVVAIQVIIFFQAKDDRAYGQLAILSLLQAMVATLFNQGVVFGVILVLHAMTGLSALALLFLVRQHRPYERHPRPEVAKAASPRWPLSGHGWGLSGSAAGAVRAAIGPEFFRRLVTMSVFTLAVSMLVFFTVPRLGQSAWRGAGAALHSIVGFNDTVTLGELGEVLQSREEVLRLRLIDAATHQAYSGGSEVFLRGSVVTRYEQGQWSYEPYFGRGRRGGRGRPWPLSPDATNPAAPDTPPPTPPPAPPPPPTVIEQIIIEPLDRRELFCVWPFSFVEENGAVHYERRRQRLSRDESTQYERFSFGLGTRAFEHHRQSPLTPCVLERIDEQNLERLKQTPDLPRLKALALEWTADATLRTRDTITRARLLEGRLRDSGLFSYSLEGQPRDLSLDPIEDFVSDHRAGHCEYFATALAMMLRAQGIPSRVVIGYKTDEWNSLGKFYQARQLHAHSWVEAYVSPAELPGDVTAADEYGQWANGGWLRLDPTPAGEGPTKGSVLDRVADAADWLQDVWSNYVMEMDGQRQREAIYGPLLAWLSAWWEAISSLDWWQERLTALGQWLGFHAGMAQKAAAALVVALALLAIALFGWLARRVVSRWQKRARAAAGHRRPAPPPVAFYQRFERLAAQLAVERRPQNTQREFAALVAEAMVARGGEASTSEAAATVCDAFYRVRFGRLPLDSQQAEAVEHSLGALERWLAAPADGKDGDFSDSRAKSPRRQENGTVPLAGTNGNRKNS